MSGDRFNTEQVLSEVRRLAELIERDRGSQPNERLTEAKYIQPLLEALGWSLPEGRLDLQHAVKASKVDMALIAGGRAVAFVEAKRLRQNLSLKDEEAAQALKYGYESGTNWCVLTNGERYEVYDAFRRVDHARKLVTSFTVTGAATDPSTALPSLRLLSYEAVTGGELGRYARASFAAERVREALGKPSPSVLDALVGELEGCGLTEDDVRLGLAELLGKAIPAVPVDPAPSQTPSATGQLAASEGKAPRPGRQPKYAVDEWGPQACEGPLRIDGDALSVSKRRTFKGDQAERRVSRDSLRKVAQTVSALALDGRTFTVSAVNDAQKPANRVSYNTVNRCLGVLFVAGLLECTPAGGNQHYGLREVLTPEQVLERVLSQAQPV